MVYLAFRELMMCTLSSLIVSCSWLILMVRGWFNHIVMDSLITLLVGAFDSGDVAV